MLRLSNRSVQLSFPGASSKFRFEGDDRQRAASNYFIGASRVSVPAYSRLRERGVYPGIDVVYYGNGGEIEYDFEIAPGADPSRIRMRFDGADSVRINDSGEIVLALGSGEVIQRAPVVYQRRASGEIVAVQASYRIARKGVVRLELAGYNRAEPLIVDPSITYAVYLSGTGADSGVVITHGMGGIYMAGNTFSMDFPATVNTAAQPANGGSQDVWIMQLDPAQGANAIIYCTFLGAGADEFVKAMAVDANGVIYVTGSTDSGAFPVTAGALISTNAANTHGFVSMIDPSQGTSGLIYSTFLGGTQNDEGDGIAVSKGLIYVTGTTDSTDFPIAGNSFQTTLIGDFDAFIVVIDPTQSGTASEVYGSYLGGSSADAGRSIALDAAGNVYIAGVTFSADFPVSLNAFQPGYTGGGDAFVAELNLNSATLIYSTFLGGSSQDEAKKMLIDPAGRVALAGYTLSPDFPTHNAAQSAFGGVANAFLAVIDLTVSQPGVGLTYSTYYGGTGGEVAYDLKLDSSGRYYLCGYTLSTNLPVTANALNPSSSGAGYSGFIAIVDPTVVGPQGLVYSSYVTSPDGSQVVYGIDVDLSGNIYALGVTTSNLFPNGYAQNSAPGKLSAFLMIFTLNPSSSAVPGTTNFDRGLLHPARQ